MTFQNGDQPRYALYVNNADFHALRLSQLTTVTKGKFLFLNNDNLCVNNIRANLGIDGGLGDVLFKKNNAARCNEQVTGFETSFFKS